jgi:hypothetical protein
MYAFLAYLFADMNYVQMMAHSIFMKAKISIFNFLVTV